MSYAIVQRQNASRRYQEALHSRRVLPVVDVGILKERDRVELIEGEIIEMSPIGHRHEVCVIRANDFLSNAMKGQALISVQNTLRLNNYNEAQPDIVVLKWRADYYAAKRFTPDHALLVIEVSDTSLRYDTKIKLPIYAATGVSELWVENLQKDLLLVCRDPAGKSYRTQLTFVRGDSVSPLAFRDVSFRVNDLLGL